MRDGALILLYKEGKVLLQLRDDDAPLLPGMWGFFGGGIEEGESPEEAVRRECYEELRYRLQSPRLAMKRSLPGRTVYVFVEEYDGSPLEQHEGKDMGWFSVGPSEMSENQRTILNELREEFR